MLGPVPDGKPIWYQKHMTHHMVAGLRPRLDRDRCANAFLIRAPEAVLASYHRVRDGFHARRDRPADAGRAVLPRRRPARPHAAGGRGPGRARRSRRRAERAMRGAAASPSTARCWPGRPGRRADRRRLGAGLVRRGRAIDRLRPAAPGAGLRRPARRAEAARREARARSTRRWRRTGCGRAALQQ